MTPPVVHPLDVSFVLAVMGVAVITSNPLGAGLAAIVGAGFFALNGYLLRRERLNEIRAAQEARK